MAIDLNKLYSAARTGAVSNKVLADVRSDFQRDYDRIIFSAAFRRLQNKTQVFPLPGSVFVHNRLTHSLEVASVGRSFGTLAGDFIASKYASDLSENSKEFYKYSLNSVIAAASLCHDIGNPAFGHSGEDAIASYFIQNGKQLSSFFSEKEWADFTHFEGNSNAIRILTQQQSGKSEGGLMLTYSTLAAIMKYPCEASASTKKEIHRKKFGFFQAEKEIFLNIASATQMKKLSEEPTIFARHPFVWLVEAADDICYSIIDLEDAHRLGIIDHSSCVAILSDLITELDAGAKQKIDAKRKIISDKNDFVSYLRSKCIGLLIKHATDIYMQNWESIAEGNYHIPLLDSIKNQCVALKQIEQFSIENIYDYSAVVEIENAGYNVMYELLDHFIPPILKENLSKSEEKALKLLPKQFLYDDNYYQKVLGVLDYISGMTDNYATELYRKIKGIEIGKIR
ncbi:dGTP triphosphohydrolase [Rhizosphaericola mali]|uniref:dGTP triphosphohydrolase n=1 Tax=Rhizosphaericola mali TaxID=2545455 RepID=UPI001CD9FD79|nr:dNTP triphosphohydrolase [Rhizosphaericola mali]